MNTTPKNNSFDRAMKAIENEFDNERAAEIRAAKRAQMFARVRKILFVLALLGLSGVAYAYRVNIKSFADTYIVKTHDAAEIAEASTTSFITTTNDVSVTNTDGSITITHTITKVAVTDADSANGTNSPATKKTAKGAAASAVNAAQANARVRDEIIDSLAK
jgi:hypothetical protein